MEKAEKAVLLQHEKAVFVWGPNSYGQLANGLIEDVLQPVIVEGIPTDVKSIFGGGGHTFAIRDNDEVLACGWNTKGQLGIPDLKNGEVKHLHPVPFFHGRKITSMAAGWDFSLACTADGTLYAWGSNSFGQLGCPQVKGFTPSPTRVEIAGRVKIVSAGLRHSMALTVDGQLYCWGSGKKGQLGTLIEGKVPTSATKPIQVGLPEGADRVKQLVCGAYHSAILTDSGQIYVWGDNKHGQMALPTSEIKNVHLPHLVSLPSLPHKIKSLHSGWTHLLALTENDDLVSWGRNNYGQLGRDTSSQGHDPNPKIITPKVKPVSQVICGSEHNMVLSEGHLYTWGWNEHGICGTGDEENVPTPQLVQPLSKYFITLIGSGNGHSFAIGYPR